MACAACLVAATTLPTVEKAAPDLAKTAGVNLAVDFSRLAAFDAIPFLLAGDLSGLASTSAIQPYIDALGGDIDAFAGLDSSSAIATFFGTDGVFNSGGVDALLPDGTPGYAALSALPVFIGSEGLLTSDAGVDALADYDALSALPVFVGSEGLLTTGNVDALADYAALSAIPVFIGEDGLLTSDAGLDALGGYDALSAVRTFVGTDGVFGTGGLAALEPNEDTGQPGYAALSAIPAYLEIPPQAPEEPAPEEPAAEGAAAELTSTLSTTSPPSLGPGPVGSFVNTVTSALPGGGTGTGTGTLSPPSSGLVGSNNPLSSVTQRAAAALPNPFTPPAPQAVPQVVDQGSNPETTPDNSGQGSRNIIRDSLKFTPESNDSRILFPSGGPGVNNGIRGWGEGLDRVKSALGINGPDDSGSGE